MAVHGQRTRDNRQSHQASLDHREHARSASTSTPESRTRRLRSHRTIEPPSDAVATARCAGSLAPGAGRCTARADRPACLGGRRRLPQGRTPLAGPGWAAVLRGLDRLAGDTLDLSLRQLGIEAPPVLVYVDKGLGASILRAGNRNWGQANPSPTASIKVARHNLLAPTSLLHECGHQFAHLTGWTAELAAELRSALSPQSSELATVWAGWASEVAADVHAFLSRRVGTAVPLGQRGGRQHARGFPHDPRRPAPLPTRTGSLQRLAMSELVRHRSLGSDRRGVGAPTPTEPARGAAADFPALSRSSVEPMELPSRWYPVRTCGRRRVPESDKRASIGHRTRSTCRRLAVTASGVQNEASGRRMGVRADPSTLNRIPAPSNRSWDPSRMTMRKPKHTDSSRHLQSITFERVCDLQIGERARIHA